MKGADWKFSKLIPDIDDMDARSKAYSDFLELEKRCCIRLNPSERKIFLFNCGFARGSGWMRDKLKGE